MKLYHGSIVTVKCPNMQKGRKTIDFGRGFYTTANFERAKKWTILERNREHGKKAVVSVYKVPDNILDREFSVLRSEDATREWLESVVNNRRGKGKNSYDLMIGPVANDQLYTAIRLYEQSVVMADAAIEMLETHKLFNQLSLHAVRVIPLLKFTESIKV